MPGRSRIHVTGVVQGVGFRPYIYRLATGLGLMGFVINTSDGVVIEVEGDGHERFAGLIESDPPPLSNIESVKEEELPPAGYGPFEIRLSESAPGGFAQVSPDIATCADCLSELMDPTDRRYLYPFINCTNCGPRYSIIKGVPYDRPLTTMQPFKMCPDCGREYDEPADRRFHAQPVACGACGPSLTFTGPDPSAVTGYQAVELAIKALKDGQVVAVKGLGGFQLACDATNHNAVRTLRERKRGNMKPFALMAPSVDAVRKYCSVTAQEEGLLAGRVRPIVLLEKLPEADGLLSAEVAPGVSTLGFMLPYTPMHHLLFFSPEGERNGLDALVMTSGNISDEPILVENREAYERLSGIADSFLVHDRDIHMRVDDSVTRVVGGVPRVIRRSRGYVPETIDLGRELPEILACGAELKNTLTITKNRYAIVSQHIGDMTNFETSGFFAETLGNLLKLFGASPAVVASDMHPDYLSTRFAVEYSLEGGAKPRMVAVQHHHAHVASCMAENGYRGKVIGVAFDGTGYGLDGKTWGSEFMVADYASFETFAHLEYMALPGGDAAVREPWRCALSALVMAYGLDDGWKVFSALKGSIAFSRGAEVVLRMLEKGVNCPPSRGMGRLFDAVSSINGVMDTISYEAEAAVLLENAAYLAPEESGSYAYSLYGGPPYTIDAGPLVRAVVDDIKKGVDRPAVAARFHNTVRDMAVRVCILARDKTGLGTVALSGGVFQNMFLFSKLEVALRDAGFRVLTHSKLPSNDGCVSLGQAAVAAEKIDAVV
jgi:hydrogenase maturation protein HypF